MRIDKPLSEKQVKEGDLIQPGVYPFEVLEATDEVSQKGNDMIKLKLKIFMQDGRERILFDYLLSSMEFKMANFCYATNLWDKYQAGEFYADDCWGKCGDLKVVIQKDKNGIYPDKSAVQDYVLSDAQAAKKQERKTAQAKGDEGFTDDEIPF